MIRAAITVMVAPIVLASCGGHGLVPSQTGALPNAFGEMGKKPTTCPTKSVQPAWIFEGSCSIGKLPPKGAKFKLVPYQGITVDVDLPKNTGNDSPFVLVDATGNKDIKGKFKGKPFPKVKGKSIIYVEAVNGKKGLNFTSGFFTFSTTSTKALPGTSCPLSLLNTKLKWTSTVTGTVKGKTITYKLPATDVGIFFAGGLPQGPIFFNVSC
jgi:hypothetical protein